MCLGFHSYFLLYFLFGFSLILHFSWPARTWEFLVLVPTYLGSSLIKVNVNLVNLGTKTHQSSTLMKEAVGDQEDQDPQASGNWWFLAKTGSSRPSPPLKCTNFLIPNPGITLINHLYLAQFFFSSSAQKHLWNNHVPNSLLCNFNFNPKMLRQLRVSGATFWIPVIPTSDPRLAQHLSLQCFCKEKLSLTLSQARFTRFPD